MATLAQLHQGVRAALTSKRIGNPVFVRYHLQGVLAAEGRDPHGAVAKVAAVVGEWIGQSAVSLFYLRDKQQATLELRYPDGACALVSVADGTNPGRGVSLLVLGSKGAIYHGLDAAHLHAWDGL